MRLRDRDLELPAAEGARALTLGLLEDLTEAARALARGEGDQPLHDFRVALRRLRTALRALRPWLGQVRGKDERRLKRLARATTGARDAEVQLAWIARQRAALGGARTPGVQRLVERLEARAQEAPPPDRLAARAERAARRLARRLGEDAPPRRGRSRAGPLSGALALLIGEETASLRRQLEAIAGPADERTVHRARIEGKRLRYLLEPLRDGRARARGAVDQLKRLQDVLGDLHDAHVLAAELREVLIDAAAERAARVHAAVYAPGAGERAVRAALDAPGPRPGLLALLRLVRARRDALHAELERSWRGGGMEALASEVAAVTAALASGGRRARPRPRPSRPRSPRTR